MLLKSYTTWSYLLVDYLLLMCYSLSLVLCDLKDERGCTWTKSLSVIKTAVDIKEPIRGVVGAHILA